MRLLTIFILTCLTIRVSGQVNSNTNPYLSILKIGRCTEKDIFSTPQKITYQEIKNNSLVLKFGVVMNCSDVDTFLVKKNLDTLYLEETTKHEWSKHAKCDCFYKVELAINNITSKPKVYRLGTKIYDSKKGFVYYSEYLRDLVTVNENNSKSMTTENLISSSLLGKKWNDSCLKILYSKLGTDSVMNFDYKGQLEYIDYDKNDGVFISFSELGQLESISFNLIRYKGKLPEKLKLNESKKEIEKRIGVPDKIETLTSETIDIKTGEQQKRTTGYTYSYFNKKLSLTFSGNLLTQVELTSNRPKP